MLDGEEVVGDTPWVGPIPRGNHSVQVVLRLSGYHNRVLLIPANKANAYKASLDPLPPSQPPASQPPASQPASPP